MLNILEYILITTKIMKESKKKLEALKEKKQYMKDIDYMYEVNKIKKQLVELEKQYSDIKKSTSYLEIMKYPIDDPYDLKFDTILLKNMISNIEKELTVKEEVKIEEKKEEPKKEEKKKKVEEKKEEVKVDEVDIANNLINESNEKFEKQIYELERKVRLLDETKAKPIKKSFIAKVLDNTYSMGISLFPFVKFKNRLLGITTSMIIINN